jgi:hypothetical protein
LLSTNLRFVIYANDNQKKPAFTELYQTGVLTRIAAVKALMVEAGGCLVFGAIRKSRFLSRLRAVASGSGLAWTISPVSAQVAESVCGRFITRSNKSYQIDSLHPAS